MRIAAMTMRVRSFFYIDRRLIPKNSAAFISKAVDKYIEARYTIYRASIYLGKIVRVLMNDKIKKIYVPMTESGFYILFCLQQPQHGYGISQQVRQMTGGELVISAGTMYGTLSKMEKDGLIAFEREEEKRKLYRITELGKEILSLEIKRIERLYKNSKGEAINE